MGKLAGVMSLGAGVLTWSSPWFITAVIIKTVNSKVKNMVLSTTAQLGIWALILTWPIFES